MFLSEARQPSRQYVFTTGWGEPVHPDTLSSLFPILIKRYNEAHGDDPLPHARLHEGL